MEKWNELIKKRFWWLFGIICLGSLAGYLLLIGGKYVWADEAYTFAMIKHSFSEIWKITAADVHPPLYYFYLKIFTFPFGYSLISAKIASLLPFVFIIAFGGIQFRKLFDEKTALLFMALFFLFPFSLLYAVEIRMYSLAAAFVFANAVYAYRCFLFGNKSDWVFFALFGVASAYTHYFALLSTGIVYGLLLIALIVKQKKKVRSWILMSAATIVLYLPWLKAFIEQLIVKVNEEYWIPAIGLKTIFGYAHSIFNAGGMELFFVFFAFAFLCLLIGVLASGKKENVWLSVCMLLVPVGTIGIGILASWLVRPVFVIRYLIPAIPILIAFEAYATGGQLNANN